MNTGYRKYKAFAPIDFPERTWPGKCITRAPQWCSVDLRDGNQALVTPMNLHRKIVFFKMLTEIGFKEIEVGFPSASETEFETLRYLIEENLIPEDVTVQVLVQARPHLIEKTFEGIRGAKNVIVHLYNSTSELQRRVVFHTDMDGVIAIAVEAAELIRQKAEEMRREYPDMQICFEYSPESFSGTEVENTVRICDRVLEALGAAPDNKVIINLPNTVELATPNCYADQVEYVSTHLKHRDSAILSIHPHNDRGTATAAAELGLMAGAERVEGTVFGNGERTGNCDLMNLAMNLYAQGIDPRLDFSNMNHIKRVYEECTRMHVHERHPYAGELVFTAFSGSHQDAINKGISYMAEHGSVHWEVPYLPIDPSDLGRQYEPIIRINSQSGKGGAAFIMHRHFGYILPKQMHPEFGAIIQETCDAAGRELKAEEVFEIFRKEYLRVNGPYVLKRYRLYEENEKMDRVQGYFDGVLSCKGRDVQLSARGNGPIDAFFNALRTVGITEYKFVSYSEHAVSTGADSQAVSYIELSRGEDVIFGVGLDHNISLSSIKGIICAINRFERRRAEQK